MLFFKCHILYIIITIIFCFFIVIDSLQFCVYFLYKYFAAFLCFISFQYILCYSYKTCKIFCFQTIHLQMCQMRRTSQTDGLCDASAAQPRVSFALFSLCCMYAAIGARRTVCFARRRFILSDRQRNSGTSQQRLPLSRRRTRRFATPTRSAAVQ